MWTIILLQVLPDNPGGIFNALSVEKIVWAMLVVVAVYLLIRLTDATVESLSRRAPRSRFFFKLIASLARFGLWLVGVFFIIAFIFAPSGQTTLAMLASVGIALGLGAQDLVKNLIGGIVVLVDRPYQLGDRVKIGDAYGEIDHIGLRSTKLTTSDDTRITIPNSQVLNDLVWNSNSGALDCQVVTEILLPHDSDPVEAIEIGYEAACSSPYLLLSKPVAVRLHDRWQDGPYVALKVKAYVYDHRFEPAMQSDITVRAKAEFLKRGMLLRWSRHDEKLPTATLRAAPSLTGKDA